MKAWPFVMFMALLMLGAAAAPAAADELRTTPSSMDPWKQVDELVKDQKFEAAAAKVESVLAEAKRQNDQVTWAKALIRTVQLRVGLHGYETAVRFLKDQSWPTDEIPHISVELFYAHALVDYLNGYSWEIRQRERLDTQAGGPVDLKLWTADQIYAEALRAYDRVLAVRDDLGKRPLKDLAEYLEPNTYPQGIRDTLRDAVSYMTADLLTNSSYWRPEESNDLYRLSLAGVLLAPASAAGDLRLADPDVHPLVRAMRVLGDLEAWHAGLNQEEAALEAHLQRLRIVHTHLTDEDKRAAMIKHLEGLLPRYQKLPWWAMGQATLAEFLEAADRPVAAKAAAQAGEQAFPHDAGGKTCAALVEDLMAPSYSFTMMSSDAAAKRSLEITHKNLERLYFRAYPVDLLGFVQSSRDYNLMPGYRDYGDLLKKPASAAWSVALPPTSDLREHRTFVTPPMSKSGLYVIMASAREDFQNDGNQIVATNFIISDLALMSRANDLGGLEAIVVKADHGTPVKDAQVTLYRFDYGKGHRPADKAVTDARGIGRFSPKTKDFASYFLIAAKGDQIAVDPQYQYLGRGAHAAGAAGSFVYTDRAIYRPGQTLHYKVVAYRGDAAQGAFKVEPKASVTVTLHDANGEVVLTETVKTNDFGSAAGELVIPSGRLLGAWTLRASFGGAAANVRVEEYKRPTFTVELKDPAEPLRLNRDATLKGEAKYYFGLPVTSGKVAWRIQREPVYPWWWGYVYGRRLGGMHDEARAQTVAAGTSKLDEKGEFTVGFHPAAEEKDGQNDVTYRYEVSADLTDEGGETRSARRSFRIGLVAIEADLTLDASFLRPDAPGKVSVTRTSLDGVGRPGKGTYRVVALAQPETTVPPSELPLPPPRPAKGAEPFSETPGDKLRSRANPEYVPEAEIARWPDGEEKAKGELVHDGQGKATLALPRLAPGAYRIRYQSTDEFGARYETFKDFIVAGEKAPLHLPALFLAESSTVNVGGTARLFVASGLKHQSMYLDLYKDGILTERHILSADRGSQLVEIPIKAADRGGFGATLTLVADHQFLRYQQTVFVPWDNKELKVEFSSFRDKLTPGAGETWQVHVSGHGAAEAAAEVLALMYDKSLDAFAPLDVPSPLVLYPNRTASGWLKTNLSMESGQTFAGRGFRRHAAAPSFIPDRLIFFGSYGIGGVGYRSHALGAALGASTMALRSAKAAAPPAAAAPMAAPASRATAESADMAADGVAGAKDDARKGGGAPGQGDAAPAPRANFSETAFFLPQLLTDKSGNVTLSFKVPDSVTAWNVWALAFTKDLKSGTVNREAKSLKDLMVRPYMPRFFREGDKAELKIVVNNASADSLSGDVTLDIVDADSGKSLLAAFGVDRPTRPFRVAASGGTNVAFTVTAPKLVGMVAFKVTAKAGALSDGELRPLPVLPSRLHLVQTRFVTLRDKDKRTMTFDDLAKHDDPTMTSEKLVVGVDAQLFYGVLKALPYLVRYPYECIEQTLNRFLSTGIVSSVFKRYPAVEKMAEKLSKRQTRLAPFAGDDPNRRMTLEESPWLMESRGDPDAGPLIDVLDSRIAKAQRDESLAKLRKAQTASGGFPWFPGGPPSPYMTLYVLHGFAKALEFGVDVPKDESVKAWGYIARYFHDEYARRMVKDDCCWELLTFLNYVASAFPDPSWMGDALTPAERQAILDHSFKHWREHSPYLKAYLALTLKRAGRAQDAKLVFDSIMDAAKTAPDQGTFWSTEDRSWLWYNDTIETHAFALRALMELEPDNPKKDGLVLWLFLNKKLNHWKSTRATAEVIYSLIHYLESEKALGVREEAKVSLGGHTQTFDFAPDVYQGKAEIVVPGPEVDPRTMASVTVEKDTKGVMFASAAWHFATDKLPAAARGDFFGVTRRYFKRAGTGKEMTLRPLEDGDAVAVGDEVEVQISLTSKHEAEYVHLRDPRGAGFEPTSTVSRWKYDLGLVWYEEVRDSGTNFFFEHLPAGEYTFKYRVRAAMAGTFRVGPAELQSMYAPEFAAYSAGNTMIVTP